MVGKFYSALDGVYQRYATEPVTNITDLVISVRGQPVLVLLEHVVDSGVPAVEHGVPHRGGRVSHHAEQLLLTIMGQLEEKLHS